MENRKRSLELTILRTFPDFTQCQILTPKEINKGIKQTTITSVIFLSFFKINSSQAREENIIAKNVKKNNIN